MADATLPIRNCRAAPPQQEIPAKCANTAIPLSDYTDEIHKSRSNLLADHYSDPPPSQESNRALRTNTLPILSRIFSFSVFAVRIPFVSASDNGNDFGNNLFSDLAPLLALFGEQVTKQYMSQSMSWAEDIIFAMAPLGIITAITGTIRVGGPAWMKAVIGRAREGRGMVEVELMSSTSTDVCELWNGGGVTRVLGSTVKSTPVLELFYLEATEDSAFRRAVPDDSSSDQTTPEMLLQGVRWKSDLTGIYDFETAKSANILSISERPNQSTDTVEHDHRNRGPPNISLNLSGQRVSGLELKGVAIIGITLQLGVVLFAGFTVLSSPWNEKFKKNNKEVESHAFPIMVAGTVFLSLGLFLCSRIIQRSTNEETWIICEPDVGFQAKVAWLQRGGVVNDQQFDSYFMQPSDRAPKFWLNKVCKTLPAALPGVSYTLQQWLGMDDRLRIKTSRKELDLVYQPTQTAMATFLTICGFIGQFVGLRGLNWSVTIAQLVATATMTALRAVVRRSLVHTVEPERIDTGYELDWMSRRLNHCSLWSVVICGTNSRPTRAPEGLATRVMNARCRLGALSPWGCEWQKTVDSTTEAIESIMKFLCTSADITLSNLPAVFKWELVVEVASGEPVAVPPNLSTFEIIELSMSRKRLSEGRGWSDWKVDKSKVEAVLGLWMLHNINSESEEAIPVRILDIETIVYERWIRRQTNPIKINSSGQTPDGEPLRIEGKPLRIVGKPSISQLSFDSQAIISEAPLESICGQSILSAFISDVAKKAVVSIEGKVRVRGGEQGVKTSFGWRNSVLDELAGKVENTGLATAEDAFLSIVTPLGKAGKLPSNLGTSELYADLAEEIQTYLEGGRYGHAEPLFLWLIDSVETSAGSYETSKKWGDACREYLLLCSACDEIRGGQYYACKAEESMGLFCERLFASFNTEPSSDGRSSKAALDIVRVVLGSKKDQQVWEGRLQKWEKRLTDWDHSADMLPTSNDSEGRTPLILATIADQATVVSQLLRKKAPLHISDNYGRTAMHYASMKGYTSILHTLLRHTGSIDELNTKDKNEKTPVELAMENNNGAAVTLLIYYGTDFNPHREDCNKALPAAIAGGHVAWIQLLLDKGAYLSTADTDGMTPLHIASKAGSEEVVRLLINRGANVLAADGDSRTSLHFAAWEGHEAVVRRLITMGADVSATDGNGWTPLHFAALEGHGAVVGLLITMGADVSATTWDRRTPLHNAAREGHEAVAGLLIDKGADCSAADMHASPPLHWAAWRGHEAVVRLLIDRGADISAATKDGRTSLHFAAVGGNEAVVRLLIDRGADASAATNNRRTPLYFAMVGGHEAVVGLLTNIGADLSATDMDRSADVSAVANDGSILRHLAAMGDLEAVARLPMDQRGDVSAVDSDWRTSLHNAAREGHEAVVDLLITMGADVSATDGDGWTPLHNAAREGHEAVVGLLIDRGADCSAADMNGSPPLHWAAWGGHEAVARLLIDRGADVSAATNDGRTSLHFAAAAGHRAVVWLLINRGADVLAATKDGRTPLHFAASAEHKAVVRLLTNIRADVLAADDTGSTPLQSATEAGHKAVVQLLMDHQF